MPPGYVLGQVVPPRPEEPEEPLYVNAKQVSHRRISVRISGIRLSRVRGELGVQGFYRTAHLPNDQSLLPGSQHQRAQHNNTLDRGFVWFSFVLGGRDQTTAK